MGIVRNAKPVKLVCAVMSSDEEKFDKVYNDLENLYGKIDFKSPRFLFDHSKYYTKEMGENLKKEFISFDKLIQIDILPQIKLTTNQLEIELSEDCQCKIKICRKINIDPGYISPAKLVLATVKNYDHRIYIGQGIYAEVTLHFTKGSFKAWPWTYMDYQSDLAMNFFTKVRNRYFEQLENLGYFKVENIDERSG